MAFSVKLWIKLSSFVKLSPLVKLSRFIHHWFHLFLPYQNLSHFRSLLDFFADLIIYKNVTAQRKVYFLYVIGFMFSFQSVYLWAFHPSPMDRLRLGDPVSLVMQTDDFYLATLALSKLTMYCIDVLFCTMKPAFLRLLEDTLFRDTTRTLTGVAYGRFTEQKTVQIAILGLVNLLNFFILAVDAVVLFLIYSLATTAIENPVGLFGNPLDTPFTCMWNVLQIILGTWTMATGLALYGKVFINIAAVGAICLGVGFRRLSHSETILAVYKRKDRIFSWTPFFQYLAYSGQTFRNLFTANVIFGRLFFAFLLVNMPISAWAIVELTLGDVSQLSRIALGFMPAHELIGCILLHCAVAKFTKRLHAPSKVLLRLNAATGHRMGNFRARLVLHHTIVRLHTDAKYGITYGSIGGLITFGSFGKCLLLYIELLMYSYKLICDI